MYLPTTKGIHINFNMVNYIEELRHNVEGRHSFLPILANFTYPIHKKTITNPLYAYAFLHKDGFNWARR